MNVAELLDDAFGRIRERVHAVVDDLDPDQLAFRPGSDANSIGWLVWHLTRVQDDHVAEAAQTRQVWTTAGWADRFALPLEPADTGFGHSSEEVAAVRVPSGELLTGYHDAVVEQTLQFVAALDAADLDRIVDRSWTPPVSLGTRLVSVVGDDLQHIGQAAYVRGLLP
jgi:uncharacterized damage-inducible protein DinB